MVRWSSVNEKFRCQPLDSILSSRRVRTRIICMVAVWLALMETILPFSLGV
jgi:hypothetical protein